MLDARGLSKSWRPGEPVLEDISLSLGRDETLTVVGPSGCGKTTLLSLLSGLTRPDAGKVFLDGRELAAPTPEAALIFQDYGLLPWRTVLQNAALGLKIKGAGRAEREAEAGARLAEVGLSGREKDYPGSLSGGERQRVAIARAFAAGARLLLLDEPFSSLDAITREKMEGLLLELWRRRRTPYLMVTHSLDQAVFLGRRVLVLAGRPARPAACLDNPDFGDPRLRESGAFFERVRELRRTVERLW